MKKYLFAFLSQVLVQLTYKFNFLTSLFNNVLGIVISVFTWLAIYVSSGRESIGHFRQDQMLNYIILVNFGAVLFSTNIVVRLGSQVRTGKLTMHLLRPYSLLSYSFSEFLGEKSVYLFLYGLFFLVSLGLGVEPVYILHLFLYLMVNVWMFFLLMSVVGTLGFYFIQMWPLRPLMSALYALFGGLLFPLQILPAPFDAALSRTPFALVGYQYTLAIQHTLRLQEIQVNILSSLIWGLIFYLIYQWSFKKGLSRYEGFGA